MKNKISYEDVFRKELDSCLDSVDIYTSNDDRERSMLSKKYNILIDIKTKAKKKEINLSEQEVELIKKAKSSKEKQKKKKEQQKQKKNRKIEKKITKNQKK